MPSRQFATDTRDQQEAGSGYFAPVERTRHMLLTTFERGGSAVSAPVSGVADGDRAYFWTWGGSASARLLRHTDAVQVTPCSTRGFITYGLPLNASARLLHGGEASRATGKLASKHPVQHRFLTLLLQWARRRQMMIYELLADDAQGQHVEGFRAPDRRGDQSGGHAVHASGEVARVYWVRTHVTDCGVASIACIWAMPAHVTLPSAKEADRQARLRASGSTRRPAAPPPAPVHEHASGTQATSLRCRWASPSPSTSLSTADPHDFHLCFRRLRLTDFHFEFRDARSRSSADCA